MSIVAASGFTEEISHPHAFLNAHSEADSAENTNIVISLQEPSVGVQPTDSNHPWSTPEFTQTSDGQSNNFPHSERSWVHVDPGKYAGGSLLGGILNRQTLMEFVW